MPELPEVEIVRQSLDQKHPPQGLFYFEDIVA